VPAALSDCHTRQPALLPPLTAACCCAGGKTPADYPAYAEVSGFAYVPPTPEAEVDARLKAFVEAAGDNKPIYCGFGGSY